MMFEEMGLTHLQHTLRSLCFKSDWKYAVFWKLKHRARMMLTWEDAYYTNSGPIDHPDQMPFSDGGYLQDPLSLAVAKMSYLVYSLGEGIVGQVAVTGKHQWIFADKPTSRCWSSSEYCDGWQTQFSAGIKTIAVIAVVPHGVVQLGSLHTVTEDMKLVTNIKNVFYSLQNSSTKSIPYSIPYTTQSNSCLSEVSAEISGFNDYPLSSNIVDISHRKIDAQSFPLPSRGISNDVPQDVISLPGVLQKKTIEVSKHIGVESTSTRDHERTDFLHTKSVFLNLDQNEHVQKAQNSKEKCGEANSGWRNMSVYSRNNDATIPYDFSRENPKFNNLIPPLDEFVNYPSLPSRLLDSAFGDGIKFDSVLHLQTEELPLPKSSEIQITESEVSCTDTVSNSLWFSSGCELHEALGQSFQNQQQSFPRSASERIEPEIIEPLERTTSSLFTMDCRPDYLLEAMIANTLSGNAKGDNSLCRSAESMLTTGKTSETPSHLKHGNVLASESVVHSDICVEEVHKKLELIWDSTDLCNMISSKDSSSNAVSTSSKLSEMTEPAKANRKRARAGENCRPRPRDRQLIQDRVKELREIVPNGSKCSIDSLLERTIKHMFFLQSVTKHAEKLRKCTESKLRDNKMKHGSSWALDVGGQEEICPLVVENLNMDGLMLVEMLCEECSRFLEIAEAIRSLGLTILKGETEARGMNIWACFVVEGQNNRSMHRMEVLWSLMQLLQPKTTM